MPDLTFKEVCDFIKKDEPKLLEGVDKLLGLAAICAPLALGPAGIALLPLITAKNELVKIGKAVFESVTGKKEEDYAALFDRMRIAYGLITYTAFFDSLDEQLPDKLRKQIALLASEKHYLAKEAVDTIEPKTQSSAQLDDIGADRYTSVEIAFPHPTESLADLEKRQRELYRQMSDGFVAFVHKLAAWDRLSSDDKTKVMGVLSKIPDVAVKCFQHQYFELCRKYEDFAIWSNLQEHKNTREIVESLSEHVQRYVALASSRKTALDIGFTKLHSVVLDIPERLTLTQAEDLAKGLSRDYEAKLSEPIIIEDKEDVEEGKAHLAFPVIRDAFIPQSFRVLRHTSKARKLEDEDTWSNLPRRDDLGAFVLSYLTSPYSTETPMLILGHPGSGKSLLTSVISAQLMSKHFTAIRVPLREVDSTAGIVPQIEEQISRITGPRHDSWIRLSGLFKNNPPVVILDGYDELLQASGKVFSGYLRDVQTFQRNQAVQDRPVRTIVTSRVTLIDKATIPQGSTIVRLLEFDDQQRMRWISIWNKTNRSYFDQAQIEPFALPKQEEADSEKVLSLAEQPLLLLMLALYDSDNNKLKNSKTIDRTVLYESLLRRFVLRERLKDRQFQDLSPTERNKELDKEMQRLGVAAIGMYNRRKLHILSSELDDDLRFFKLERPHTVEIVRALTQADLLLGSFFFVHKSKALQKGGAPEHHEEASAFEFLHNTFGEFLVADFLLRRTVDEVESLTGMKNNERLHSDLEQKLAGPDSFSRPWLACLIYTPLYTRPVVLEMMREWVDHFLKIKKISKSEFLSFLDMIVLNQLSRIVTQREMPSIFRKEIASDGSRVPFALYPLLGHVAIYSLNLIILRTMVGDTGFVFDESSVAAHEDGTRPWDQLTHIWRSWFSVDNLNGITAILTAQRRDSKISFRPKAVFRVSESSNRLQTFFNISVALADDICAGLAGLLLHDPSFEGPISIDDISEKLNAEHIELRWQISLFRLFSAERTFPEPSTDQFFNIARETLHIALRMGRFQEWPSVIGSIRRGLQNRLSTYRSSEHPAESGHIADAEKLLETLFQPRYVIELAERNPEAALSCIQLIREFIGERWLGQHRTRELMERILYPPRFLEFAEHDPEAALSYLKLAREVNGEAWLRRNAGELIARRFSPKQIIRLFSQNSRAALGWMEILVSLESRTRSEYIEEVLRGIMSSSLLLNLAETDPKAALRLLRWLRSMSETPVTFSKRFLYQVYNVRKFSELARWDPESALNWIHLLRELGGEEWLNDTAEELLGSVHPAQMLDLANWAPEELLQCIALMGDPVQQRWLELGESRTYQHLFAPDFLKRLLAEQPNAMWGAIKLARALDSSRAARAIAKAIEASVENGNPNVFRGLPLESLPDLRWISKFEPNGRFFAALEALTSARKDN